MPIKDDSAEKITDMLWQMYESNAGPIFPGIAFKILQLVQSNQLTMVQKPALELQIEIFDFTDREKDIPNLLVQVVTFK